MIYKYSLTNTISIVLKPVVVRRSVCICCVVDDVVHCLANLHVGALQQQPLF